MESIRVASNHNNWMVSMDVVILFSRIPTENIVPVVRNNLESDHYLEERNRIPMKIKCL